MENQALVILKEIANNVSGLPGWWLVITQIANLLILWITLWKLIEYTRATTGLLQAAELQHITEIRPFLRLKKGEPLTLINDGQGISVDVKLKYIKGEDQLDLYSIPAMSPGGRTNQVIHDKGQRDFNPETNEYSVQANYKDIEGREYQALFEADYSFNDRFKIVKQELIS